MVVDLLTSWMFWMGLGLVGVLGFLALSTAGPRAAGRRVAAGVPQRAEDAGQGADHRLHGEPALFAAVAVHDERLDDAHHALVEARVGTMDERLFSLGRAEEFIREAEAARPDSPAAAELMAHVQYARFQLAETPQEQERALRSAADWFLRTTELRPSELDPNLGAGAVFIGLGRQWSGDAASEAFDVAAGAYERAFGVARNNRHLMRSWAQAIDGLRRHQSDADSEERYRRRLSAYEWALTEHRSGDHDLKPWFERLLNGEEPPEAPHFDLA